MGLLRWRASRDITASARTSRETFVVDRAAIDPSFYGMASYVGSAAEGGRVTRTEAITVGAVKRARDLICTTVGALPAILLDARNERVPSDLLEQPEWDAPRAVTMTATLDDMLFHGASWWRITERAFYGYPSRVRRLLPGTVRVERNQRVYARANGTAQGSAWEYVEDRDLIRFDSPTDPLLVAGARAIRTSLALDAAAARYADNPQMQGYFTPAEGADPASDEAVVSMLDAWEDARQARITGYVPGSLKYNEAKQWSPADMQLAEARQHAALEIARLVNIDAGYLDANPAASSETYANSVDKRRDLIDFTLSGFISAIEGRLSMADVTPPGYRVRLDPTQFVRSNESERYDIYAKAVSLGAYGLDEVARREELPEPPGPPAPPPAPEPDPEDDPDQQEDDEMQSVDNSARTALSFAGESTRATFDFGSDGATFAADVESRTVKGLIVPWGKVAAKGGRNYSFQRGSVKWSDLGRVKLLRDHDFSRAVGRALAIEDTPEGLVGTFRVARGRAGDEVLSLAEDGVLDGFSVGVDFRLGKDTRPGPGGVTLVTSSALRETSILANPAFDDARLTSVAASADEGATPMDDETTGQPAPVVPAAAPDLTAQISAAVQAAFAAQTPAVAPVPPPAVVPAGRPVTFVSEGTPYQFDRSGAFVDSEVDFSCDLHEMIARHGMSGAKIPLAHAETYEAGKRATGLIREIFTVVTGDVNELNPVIETGNYIDVPSYRTPLWNMVRKGSPPNGVNPFVWPKKSSSAGPAATPLMVNAHTEGTEPGTGDYVTTSQTITPSALSGKASITREVWDLGGNPAVSTLIKGQMVRDFQEGLEAATSTFLATLTAAADITLGVAATDAAFVAAWETALTDLQFVRGYDFSAFALEKETYKKFAGAKDTTGRPIYPILNAMNANGGASSRFRQLDLAGVTGVPCWALASTAGALNNSWLFDPAVVHGWATGLQEFQFAGTNGAGAYAPTAFVDLAVFAYRAFACSDILGVRQVTYDTTT